MKDFLKLNKMFLRAWFYLQSNERMNEQANMNEIRVKNSLQQQKCFSHFWLNYMELLLFQEVKSIVRVRACVRLYVPFMFMQYISNLKQLINAHEIARVNMKSELLYRL